MKKVSYIIIVCFPAVIEILDNTVRYGLILLFEMNDLEHAQLRIVGPLCRFEDGSGLQKATIQVSGVILSCPS